jgi:LPXTG-motif cell wall-anchored protein
MASVGSNYADFEQELHVYWRDRFNFLALLMDSMYFWLGLAIILIIGGILAIRRRRSYYRKWEEEEKYASTDFDYGDPDDPEQVDDDEPWRH